MEKREQISDSLLLFLVNPRFIRTWYLEMANGWEADKLKSRVSTWGNCMDGDDNKQNTWVRVNLEAKEISFGYFEFEMVVR